MSQILLVTFLSLFINGFPAANATSLDVSASIKCTIDSDCYPSEVNETNEYIKCEQNLCLCYPCFQHNSNGTCKLSDCFEFSNRTCYDKRHSQREAFLLSLFLSSLGVANFYINNYELALIQLSLTVVLFFICMSCCCYFWCFMLCYEECTNPCLSSCILVFCGAVGIMIFSIISCWWLIDLVVFGLNQRKDGNGCILNNDL